MMVVVQQNQNACDSQGWCHTKSPYQIQGRHDRQSQLTRLSPSYAHRSAANIGLGHRHIGSGRSNHGSAFGRQGNQQSNGHRTTHHCCNCGGEGHIHRQCNQPITSFGCIVYRLVYDKIGNSVRPEYLMVQRKDSLAYVEFIRGKYKLENVAYITQLMSCMTREELDCLLNDDFQELWRKLWTYGSNKCYVKEQQESEAKLTKLKTGYTLVDPLTDLRRCICLKDIVASLPSCLHETEWGWPKGRRNLMESDKSCATREFREETGIRPTNIRIRFEKPVEEVFTGSNHVRYKHVYYIAEYIPNKTSATTEGRECLSEASQEITQGFQVSEIKSVRWFSFNDAQDKLRTSNIEKGELLKRVNNLILRRNVCFDAPAIVAAST